MIKKRLLSAVVFVLILLVFFIFSANITNKEVNLSRLKSLPYMEYGVQKAEINKTGVTLYRPNLTFEGYNIVDGYYLLDMNGDTIYTLPGEGGIVSFLENGSFFRVSWNGSKYNDSRLTKYDSKFNLEVDRKILLHHDFEVLPGSSILTLSKEKKRYKDRDVVFDVILHLSADGEEIERWSTYDNLKELQKYHFPSPLDEPSFLPKGPDGEYDYYHLNSVQSIPFNKWSINDSRFQEGNWLISSRHTNLIFILDKYNKKIVWTYGPGELEGQHSPKMMKNGNILIFDNGYNDRNYSRILEINPISKKIQWEYTANQPESFYSDKMGYAQILPNKNVLITDSVNGHVFEITPEKETVWEWFNPNLNEYNHRAIIGRVVRIDKEYGDNLIKIWKS